jgi:hypothetical protein
MGIAGFDFRRLICISPVFTVNAEYLTEIQGSEAVNIVVHASPLSLNSSLSVTFFSDRIATVETPYTS